jgi:hypothetical protein
MGADEEPYLSYLDKESGNAIKENPWLLKQFPVGLKEGLDITDPIP